jgi:hypothetical protein
VWGALRWAPFTGIAIHFDDPLASSSMHPPLLLGTVHDYTNMPLRLIMRKRGQECRRAIAARKKAHVAAKRALPGLTGDNGNSERVQDTQLQREKLHKKAYERRISTEKQVETC